jgi:hypothetical protein
LQPSPAEQSLLPLHLQAPIEQSCVPGQVLPWQAQKPETYEVSGKTKKLHVPLAQTVPHPPQFAASNDVSTHLVPQQTNAVFVPHVL